MEKQTDFYEKDAWKWLEKSISALLTHKRENKGFIRNSNQLAPKEGDIFPTATFQGFAALLDCSSDLAELSDHIIEIESLIREENFPNFIKDTTNKADRAIILFEQILFILSQLSKKKQDYSCDIKFKRLKDYIIGETDDVKKERSNKYYYPTVGSSPWFLLSLFNCQEYIYDIYGKELSKQLEGISTKDKEERKKEEQEIIASFRTEYRLFDKEDSDLEDRIDDHINYHLARHNVKELSFDSISLAVAICCKLKINSKFKESPFFISCIKAIVDQQYSDGCLPTGATISFADSGDVIQQASIQIMSFLADAIVDYKFLVDCNDQTEELLNIICPAFRKMAKYMDFSYESFSVTNNSEKISLKGWGSDRLKIKNYTETWIVSYTCRFFYKYWLLEKAYLRIKALKYLGVDNYVYSKAATEEKIRYWKEDIIEPDNILKPKEKITEIIAPIWHDRDNEKLLITPQKKNSYIICGPPGSGKTYIVKQMAKAIGWPLVELSPSQFIKNGLDFIESTNKEIFDNLYSLHHAVVLFDECDELFKDRNADNNSPNRTILNFLTASMLPKLQDLYDKKNIIYVVGTNYLHRIDPAIRREGRFDYRILFDRPDPIARGAFYDANKNKKEVLDILKEKSEEIVIKEAFINNTVTVLTKNLTKYFSPSHNINPDQDYFNWCHAKRNKRKSGEDEYVADGILELECVANGSEFDSKSDNWKEFETKKQ